MTKLNLSINDVIEVIYNNKVYKSNVQDMYEEYIGISVPINEGKYVSLRIDDVLDVIYVNENATFKFATKVIGREVERIPIVLISLPKEIIKIQRRLLVRVPLIQYINYKCCKGIMPDDNMVQSMVKEDLLISRGNLIDLSGGGMKIKVSKDVSIGDIIISKLNIDNEDIVVKGKIVRIEEDEDKKAVCGVKFINISDRDSDKIVGYLFKVMRKQIARS